MWRQLFSRDARRHQQALEMLEHIAYIPGTIGQPADREAGWEYLYLAAELARYLSALEPTRLELVNVTTAPAGPPVADPPGELTHAMETISTTVALTETIFSPAHLEGAFGPPGVPADVVAIAHIASELAGVYLNLIHVALDVKSTNFGQFHDVATDLADVCLGPISQIQAFSAALSDNVQRVAEGVRGGQAQTTPLQLALTISVDDAVMARLNGHLDALVRARKG